MTVGRNDLGAPFFNPCVKERTSALSPFVNYTCQPDR